MKILILVLLLASLMLGANALDVRVSQGNGDSGAVVDMCSAANVNDFVDQEIKANPSSGELPVHMLLAVQDLRIGPSMEDMAAMPDRVSP